MPGTITEVVEQHAEEAAFLWLLRDGAVHAPNYSVADLAELDDRVGAHLDGLRIAGDDGWEICKEALGWDEPGEVFAAAQVAFQGDDDSRVVDVLEAGAKSVELARGVISALGWLPYERAAPHIERLLASDDPIHRRIAIGTAAVHRADLGAAMATAMADGDAIVRPRALRAAGELGRMGLLPRCQEAFGADDDDSRFWAGWSAALLGDPSSTRVLWEFAAGGGPFAHRACEIAARRITPGQALEWQQRLAEMEPHGELAIIVARVLGDPAVVPWLIEAMRVADLARPAGEAFSSITGLDLADSNFEGQQPEGFEAGPTENPDDEDVAMDSHEDLPWPDPDLVSAWWSKNQGMFSPGVRHLCGYPMDANTLAVVLRIGTQRQRASAALELVLLQPGRPLFEVRAHGDRQKRLLGG